MMNRSSGRAITNIDLMIEDAHLHMQSKLAAMLKLSEKHKADSPNGMDPDLFVEYVQAELAVIDEVYTSTSSVRAATIWAKYCTERGHYSAIVDLNTHWNSSDERVEYYRWPRQYARCSREEGYIMPLVYLRKLAKEQVVMVPTSSLPPKLTAITYWRAPGLDKANIGLISPEHAMLSTPMGQKN